MTSEKRIEKFMLTLTHLDNCMGKLLNMAKDEIIIDLTMAKNEEMIKSIKEIKATIKSVIDANVDQIDIGR